MDNDRLIEVNPAFEEIAVKRGFYSQELMALIAEHGSVHGVDDVPERYPERVRDGARHRAGMACPMQAAYQKFTDNAVSKTVNFANEATAEDVRRVYDLAHELGVKGVTIYRDGSKEGQVLSTGKTGQGVSRR